MCKITVEEMIERLETYEAEHCISISTDPRTEKKCLEIWEECSGCTIDIIQLPES